MGNKTPPITPAEILAPDFRILISRGYGGEQGARQGSRGEATHTVARMEQELANAKSDPAVCTSDAPAMHSIPLGSLSNNCWEIFYGDAHIHVYNSYP